jgi:integrase
MKRVMDITGWTESETTQIMSYSKTHNFYLWVAMRLSLETGLRAGELYALEWGDVDIDRRTLRVSKAYNHKLRKVMPVTKNRRVRFVPVAPDTTDFLRTLKATRSNDHNFVMYRHQDFDAGRQSQALKALCREAGVPEMRWHDLRALYASRLLLQGISLAHVMLICGWTQLSTVQRYLRLSGQGVSGLVDGVKFAGL